MEYGAHLPLIDFGDGSYTLPRLQKYAATARDLGFRYLAANDHLIFPKPWLDGPTARAAAPAESGDMTLATTGARVMSPDPARTAARAVGPSSQGLGKMR